jgi:hypothetical protein
MNLAQEQRATNAPKPGITMIRLLLTLLIGAFCGLGLGLLYDHDLPYSLVYAIFLVPLCMGIAAPFVVDRRSTHVLPLGLCVGFLAWFGMAIPMLIWAAQQEAAYATYCQTPDAPMECARGEGWTTFGVFFYLGASILLIFLGALIVGLVLKFVRKRSSTSSPESRRAE